MDLEILKKKISTYRSEGGRLRNVSDELLMEILYAWEHWSGPISGFYGALGVDHRKMATLISKAKKLKREGHFPVENFKEIKVETPTESPITCEGAIVLKWEKNRVIKFSQVDQLVDFLKKVA